MSEHDRERYAAQAFVKAMSDNDKLKMEEREAIRSSQPVDLRDPWIAHSANSLKEVARLALAAKVIGDYVKSQAIDAKALAAVLMDEVGADRVRITHDDGEDLGTLAFTKGATQARVSDGDALLEWVQLRHPERVKVVTTTVIDPEWLNRTLSTAKQLGDPVDTETGEVIPGITIEQGPPHLTTRSTPAARERMEALLQSSGALALTFQPTQEN